MMRFVSGLILTLLLMSMSTLVLNFQPVKSEWTGTVYIRADGSIDPREAPIITYDNVTYTLTGDIISSADGIVVERSDIVIDGANYMLKGKGNETGIYLGGISAVIIQNIGITGFYYGLYLYDSSGNTISESNITNNKYGIYHSSSSYNTITRDQVTDNDCGIFLDSSSNNVISANNITNSEFGTGIESSYSFNNSVVGNIFTGCGLLLPPGNRVENNTVNGKPLVYLESVSDFNVEEAGQVILFDCNNIRVKNLNLSNASLGLMLWNTNNSVITNITANNNCYGIMLINSTDNTIFGGYMANNYYGVWMDSSSNDNITENNIPGNKYIGVALTSSSCFNCISENNISATSYGLALGESSNNNWISGNDIENNEYGIMFGNSSNNNIYHNNFVNNTRQLYDISWDDPQFPPSINIWDDGYPSGGNYWSDYTGVDEKSGPNQDQPGSDGIGDTPYLIDENNVDRYPLMKPFSSGAFTFVFPRTSLFNVGNVEFYLPGLHVEGFVSVDGGGYIKINVKNLNANLYANTLRIGSMSFSFQWRIIRAEGGEENTLPVYTYADADDWLYVGEMIVTINVGNLEPWSKRFNFTLDLTKLEKQAEEFYEWVTKILDALDKAQDVLDLINKIRDILSSFGTAEICPVIITINPDLIMRWLPDSLNPWGQYSAVYAVACPANLYITSPSGLPIGTNHNGEEVNQIPNSYYSGKNVGPQIVWLLNASTGDYKVDLIGTQNGSTTCGVALITPANISTSAIQIEVSEGQIIHLESTVSPDTLTIPEFPSIFVPALIIMSCLIVLAVSKKKEEKHVRPT